MQNQFSRTQLLLGKPAMDTLAGAHVAVFGVGGVGGHVVEVLARSGVGEITLIDNDRVCLSNLNRQMVALMSTLDRYKVDVAEERIHDINPECVVHKHQMFYLPDNADEIDLGQFDYVADCIDTVAAKLELIRRCHASGIMLLSCMGAANKLDVTRLQVTDLSKTKMDPLAKILRKRLRKSGISHLKVVYSDEEPLAPLMELSIGEEASGVDGTSGGDGRQNVPASNAFVPAAAGLILGGEIVKDLIARAGTMRQTTDAVPDSSADTGMA